MNKIFWLLIIFCLALFLRLWWLDAFPVGITHDEMDYVINAKSIFYTGKDISGQWSPFSLTSKSIGNPIAAFPSLLVSPFIGPFNLSLFTARLPYAIISVFTVIVISLIAYKLLGREVGIISGLLFAINPWSIHFGRTAFEAPVAILFYLLALYISLNTKNWKILYVFPFLFLAFFSYHGTKIIFLPFVLIIIAFSYYWNGKKHELIKPLLTLLFLCIAVFIYFVFSLKYQTVGERTNELVFFPNSETSNLVDSERKLAIPSKLNNIFSNKITSFGRTITEKYLLAFSTDFLFLRGEQRGAYSTWFHGPFYYIDVFFLLIGLVAMFKRKSKECLLFLALVLIAPIPSIVSRLGESYVLRSSLMFPFLVIFIAYGIWRAISFFKKYSKFMIVLISIIYFISFAYFYHLYLYRYPVYGSEGFFFSERVLSEYILRAKNKDRKVYVLVQDPSKTFEQYLFYSGIYDNKDNIQNIAEKIRNETFSFQEVFLINDCLEEELINEDIVIIKSKDMICLNLLKEIKEKEVLHISALSDGGSIFQIYNDVLCQKYNLKTYPRVSSREEFYLKTQEDIDFCEKWISKSMN